MLYNLYKKVFKLNRSAQEYLHDSFDSIVSAIKSQEGEKIVTAKNQREAERIISKNIIFKEVLAGGLHDPETPEEMSRLIDLMEKFIGIDNNVSHDNIGIFIAPMSMGARKITLRPCKIVGLMRILDRLSRKYKMSDGNDLILTKSDFDKSLSEIKERLKGIVKNKTNHPKILNPQKIQRKRLF